MPAGNVHQRKHRRTARKAPRSTSDAESWPTLPSNLRVGVTVPTGCSHKKTYSEILRAGIDVRNSRIFNARQTTHIEKQKMMTKAWDKDPPFLEKVHY